MKQPRSLSRIAALAVAVGLAFASQAQDDASNAARQKELEVARAELQRAAKRVAELSRAEEMAMHKRIERRPMLGVLLAPDPQAGVRVTGVTPDSGAARSGLRAGDQLVQLGGKPIPGATAEARLASATATLGKLKVGEPIDVTFRRGTSELKVEVAPQPGRPVLVFTEDGSNGGRTGTRVVMSRDGEEVVNVDHFDFAWEGFDFPPTELAITPEIQRELQRVRELSECEGEHCVLPRLTEAYRWNGLNLSSVDAQLGRYFGTERGVLVLSTGPELTGLQAGDVIQRIDGKAVDSPREVMDALLGRSADSSVNIDYLRDRRTATAAVKIPRATSLRIPLPPAPPAPPAPPSPPASAAPAPPAPPAAGRVTPPAPPAAPKAPKAPSPPAPPPAPALGVPV